MTLGIIIPTYDSLDTLKVLIKNIFDYTGGEYQIYVVEDGQKQETIDYLKTQKVKAIFHQENKGVAPSWNDGLREAIKDNCDYFAFFNDDIELPPNWWDACQKEFSKMYAGQTSPTHAVCLAEFVNNTIPLTGWFFILDKYCVDEVGFFDEQFVPYCAEDEDYYFRMEKKGICLCRIENLNVFHHGSHTLNKLRQIDLNKVEENRKNNWIRLQKKHLDRFLKYQL